VRLVAACAGAAGGPFFHWVPIHPHQEVARDRTAFADAGEGAQRDGSLRVSSVCLVLLISHSVLHPGATQSFCSVAISDVLVVGWLDLATPSFAAVEKLGKSAENYVVLSASRTLAAVT